MRRNRTSYWIAWEKCFQLLCISRFSVILKEGKMFNQNKPLSGQQLRNVNIVSCISGAERRKCEQKLGGWCNMKTSGFLYLQVGIFPFWLYTPPPDDISLTPVSWRCPAPPAVHLESLRYILLCASLWLGFHLFEQEEVRRRYAGHVGTWNTVMLCFTMKFWIDISMLMLKVVLSASIVCPFYTYVPWHRQS